jgi:HemK-related putative methylase
MQQRKNLKESYIEVIIMLLLQKKAIKSIKEFLDKNTNNSLLFRLFHLNERIRYSQIKNAIGKSILNEFLEVKLILRQGNHITTNYDIATHKNYHFFYNNKDWIDTVYFGTDSLILADYLPKQKNLKVLDLCTGCGIQAIIMSGSAKEVYGTDINPKAVNAARFNAILNNANVKMLEGDLYEPVIGKKFDLIVSNPPLIPIPDNYNYPICGKAGEDGLSIFKRIVENLKDHIVDGGQAILLGGSIGNEEPKVKDILQGFDFELVILDKISKEQEIMNRASLLQRYNKAPLEDIHRIYSAHNFFYKYIVRIRT